MPSCSRTTKDDVKKRMLNTYETQNSNIDMQVVYYVRLPLTQAHRGHDVSLLVMHHDKFCITTFI